MCSLRECSLLPPFSSHLSYRFWMRLARNTVQWYLALYSFSRTETSFQYVKHAVGDLTSTKSKLFANCSINTESLRAAVVVGFLFFNVLPSASSFCSLVLLRLHKHLFICETGSICGRLWSPPARHGYRFPQSCLCVRHIPCGLWLWSLKVAYTVSAFRVKMNCQLLCRRVQTWHFIC